MLCVQAREVEHTGGTQSSVSVGEGDEANQEDEERLSDGGSAEAGSGDEDDSEADAASGDEEEDEEDEEQEDEEGSEEALDSGSDDGDGVAEGGDDEEDAAVGCSAPVTPEAEDGSREPSVATSPIGIDSPSAEAVRMLRSSHGNGDPLHTNLPYTRCRSSCYESRRRTCAGRTRQR